MTFGVTSQFVPGDEAGMSRFLLDHYVRHRLYVDALLGQTPSFRAVDLPIQRVSSWRDWLAAHQQMSASIWQGLGGGQSTDFGSLKLDEKGNPDPEAFLDWMLYHQQWHSSVDTSLGL